MPRLISRSTGAALATAGLCLALAAVAAVLFAATSSASGAESARTAAPTVSAHHTSKGTILVASDGHTLYAFSRDRPGREACAEIRGCTKEWPIVTATGSVSAGRGVNRAKLGTIMVHGTRQVTYAGHPLYRFDDDHGPASTDYIGVTEFGGSWPAVSPSGGLVH